jgi:TPR repeat protein
VGLQLARCLETGRGVARQDVPVARKWYRQVTKS